MTTETQHEWHLRVQAYEPQCAGCKARVLADVREAYERCAEADTQALVRSARLAGRKAA